VESRKTRKLHNPLEFYAAFAPRQPSKLSPSPLFRQAIDECADAADYYSGLADRTDRRTGADPYGHKKGRLG